MQVTIQSEAATYRQQSALRSKANTLRIDLNAATLHHFNCAPELLSKRGANLMHKYLDSADCRERFAVKRQPRCIKCRVPVEECECGGSVG